MHWIKGKIRLSIEYDKYIFGYCDIYLMVDMLNISDKCFFLLISAKKQQQKNNFICQLTAPKISRIIISIE